MKRRKNRTEKRIINNIRYQRKLFRYSLKDIAFLLGLKSTSVISRWERGKERPNMDNLLCLAFIFRTPVESLYFEYRKKLSKPIHQREQLLSAKRKKSHEP